MRISANGAFVYVDYVLAVIKDGARTALIYSCFDRSEIALRSFTANLSLCSTINLYVENKENDIYYFPKANTKNYHVRLMNGKEPVNHAVCIAETINEKYLITTKESKERDIYNWLMNRFDLPLLTDWIGYLCSAGGKQIKEIDTEVYGKEESWMTEMVVYEITMTDDNLRKMITDGLKSGQIRISQKPQKPLEFKDMDDYFMKYGNSLISNLEKKLNPLVELKDTVEEIAFLKKRFFPQQAAIVNGLIECMNHSSYAFVNEDMGCGKTLQGMGVPEGYFNRMFINTLDCSIGTIYKDSSITKYRNIIMCPPHLVKKWKEAIETDIPYARVVVIRGLKELCRLRKQGKERTGKEFYIMSKETGKLSYTYIPLPTQYKKKQASVTVCSKCGKPRPVTMPITCDCGCREWVLKFCGFQDKGLICPECDQLLYPADVERYIPDKEKMPLQPSDFAMQTVANHICRNCGTTLWQPACEPVNRTLTFRPIKIRKKKWIRMTHWSNMAKKNKKSVWVHENWKDVYIQENRLSEDEISYPKVTGVRKYAPSRFIKKYLKGFFDFAIFDEAHEYKGGGSAQGMAMHDLVKASKWQLALTGTIAGGYANHFFYLLFRLDPGKMRSMGYTFDAAGEWRFVEDYGTIASEYEVEENDAYHTMSRGRKIGSPKCRPGISLRIFTDFLLDRAVFLNLSDMSSYLPPLEETVEYVSLEPEISEAYHCVRKEMKEAMKEQELGKALLGTFLQFSLSYTDKPYGRESILSPIDGSRISSVPDLSYLISEGKLLNKEKKLCEYISSELSMDRRVFVYCEYTGKGEARISDRIKTVILKECALKAKEVAILESDSPCAEDREEWMHMMAAKGVKVFITNPRCVRTGLDFLFDYKEVTYNYPTIIFYQYSYDLFTMWQASRRHYRLNQVLKCRTIYIVSENTIQIDALEMVASKQVATSAIQGRFSSEGLCAMAQGVDPKIKLAQAVTEKSPEQMKGLKSMFDVLNQWHNGKEEKQEFTKMKIFEELTGIKISERVSRSGGFLTDAGESIDLFALLKFDNQKRDKEEKELSEKETLEKEEREKEREVQEEPFSTFLFNQKELESLVCKGKKKDKKKEDSRMGKLFHF